MMALMAACQRRQHKVVKPGAPAGAQRLMGNEARVCVFGVRLQENV